MFESVATDTPEAPFVADGVMGIILATFEPDKYAIAAASGAANTLDVAAEMRSEMLVEDYATLALQRFEAFMQKIATENGVYDPSFLETVKKKVHTLASDGAPSERRSIFLAALKYLLNAGVLIRDPAHAIRLAVVKPLRVEEMFTPVLKELIGPVKAERRLPKPASGGAHGIKGGGLIHEITNAEKWKALLVDSYREMFSTLRR